jgi:MFS family permease
MIDSSVTEHPSEDSGGKKFGPIELTPGVTHGNVWSLAWGAFWTIGLVAFVSVATPYVLTANLGVPESEQGTITGDLLFWAEVTQILIFGLVGVAADRFGRNWLFAMGLLGMGAAYTFYPFAESVGELTIYRIIYALGLGASAGMLATVVADYPKEDSRGKMLAFVGMLNGLGVVLVIALLGNLPNMLVDAGYSAITAGRYTHGVAVALCVLTAVVVGFGLMKGTPVRQEDRLPVLQLFRAGVYEGRNPRIALAYASGFVARGDQVILGTFTILWGKTWGMSQGMEPAAAIAIGTLIFVISQISALLWIPVLGPMLDRVNRVTGLIVCMSLATVGYLGTMFVEDPTARVAIPIFVMLGVGQISAFLGSAILIGQEAPKSERGSVVGVFNSFGAVGILIASVIGGRLFDAIGPYGPFMLVGSMNGAVLLMAIVVRIRAPGPMKA